MADEQNVFREGLKGGQGQVIEAETFRDSVKTMDQSGKRKWVFPRKPSGRYTNYRTLVAILLLAVFFALPFIKINFKISYPFLSGFQLSVKIVIN